MMKYSLKPRPDNRRKHFRLVMDAPVGVAELRPPFAFLVRRPQFEGKTADASLGGLELLLDRDLPAGCEIRVWIQVAIGLDIETLRMDGVVRWSRPASQAGSFQAGIQLHTRPRKAMQAWAAAMQEEMVLMADTARFGVPGPGTGKLATNSPKRNR